MAGIGELHISFDVEWLLNFHWQVHSNLSFVAIKAMLTGETLVFASNCSSTQTLHHKNFTLIGIPGNKTRCTSPGTEIEAFF